MTWVGWRCQACRHEMRHNPRLCPMCDYTVYDPIHDHERPDWVNPPSTEPETPPAGTGTSAEGSQAASEEPRAVSAAFPALWWSPSGGYFERAPDDPATFDALMVGDGLGSDGLPADAQRLVPVGPLLELVRQWERRAGELAGQKQESADPYRLWRSAKSEGGAESYADAAADIRSLLGESPESHARQEGQ